MTQTTQEQLEKLKEELSKTIKPLMMPVVSQINALGTVLDLIKVTAPEHLYISIKEQIKIEIDNMLSER